MIVHPDIAALRNDHGPQRHAQVAMKVALDGWVSDTGVADVVEDLTAFGNGAALEDCPRLEAIFSLPAAAAHLVARLSHHFCLQLAEHPLAHPPFRNGSDHIVTSLQLARAGRAQLVLQAREPVAIDYKGCLFSDSVRYDAVISGRATARIVRIAEDSGKAVCYASETVSLEPGGMFAFDLSSEVMQIDKVEQRLVMLRLVRNHQNPAPMREYDAENGELLGQSAGALATSRQEAIIALLGRMGRTDAASTFTKVALDQGDTSLRWQAVRECLAIDSGEGFRTLSALAQRETDPLASPAGALRAQLLETYPQFSQLEAEQCPT